LLEALVGYLYVVPCAIYLRLGYFCAEWCRYEQNGFLQFNSVAARYRVRSHRRRRISTTSWFAQFSVFFIISECWIFLLAISCACCSSIFRFYDHVVWTKLHI